MYTTLIIEAEWVLLNRRLTLHRDKMQFSVDLSSIFQYVLLMYISYIHNCQFYNIGLSLLLIYELC